MSVEIGLSTGVRYFSGNMDGDDDDNEEKEESDDSQQSAAEELQSIDAIKKCIPTLQNVPEEHLNSLYALHTMCVKERVQFMLNLCCCLLYTSRCV